MPVDMWIAPDLGAKPIPYQPTRLVVIAWPNVNPISLFPLQDMAKVCRSRCAKGAKAVGSRKITAEDVKLLQGVSPRRKRFADHPVVYERKGEDRHIVSTAFPSIDRLFQMETKISTRDGPYGPFRFLTDEAEIKRALEWQEKHSHLIFLRDMLDSSVALDFNLAEAGIYTELGLAEHNAKASHEEAAIKFLSKQCAKAIADLAFYQSCEAICAVPPSPGKQWDLPTEIAKRVAAKCGKADISAQVAFTREKKSVKSVSLADKWAALEAGNLVVKSSMKGKRVILIDDKYQSGTTAQFVAAKLLDAGAAEVHGLFCIKTWRDTDNT